jgi:uncharacterized protein (TIGR02145 family)
MKHLTLLSLSLSLLFFVTVSLSAQEYLVSFESSGIATKIDTIIVKNTTTGATVVLTGDQALHLKSTLSRNAWDETYPNGAMTLFPNPTDGISTLEFETPETGSVDVDLYNGTGLKLAQVQRTLPPGRHSYQVSGINSGIYLVRVNSGGYVFVGKLVSNSTLSDRPSLVYLNSVVNEDAADRLKSMESMNSLEFKPGDKLLFTMISGDYSTTITATPEQDKSITGNFYDCVDMDNNIYPIVEIGNQVWMAANLKTTKYSDGTPIPNVTTTQWANLSTPAYSWRKNDESFKNPYGALYNWHTVNTGKLCPSGWHVPSEDEWMALESYVGGNSVTGSRLKETGTRHWDSPNAYADNRTGFSMVGGGYRVYNGGTDFFEFGRSGFLWTSTQTDGANAKYRGFGVDFARIDRGTSNKSTGFSVRCVMNDNGPVIKTGDMTEIALTSAIAELTIIAGSSTLIGEMGFCWGTNAAVDINSSKMSFGQGSNGTYKAMISGLLTNTVYYIRAYAWFDGKLTYGNVVSFRTLYYSSGLTDYDGNEYKTVTIGKQTWMAENLKTTHFRNGVAIPEATRTSDWVSTTSPAFSWRNNNMGTYKNPYGALYNWYAVNDENLCPAGYRMPTDADFKELEQAVGGRSVAGGLLKESGTSHWAAPNTGATNSTGFAMLPGGYRTGEGTASFYELGRNGYLWTATGWQSESEAFYWGFSKDDARTQQGISGMNTGFSVRCLQSNVPYNQVTDRDGNVYKTVKIGNQTWMAENLRTTHYLNGDPIPTMEGSLMDSIEPKYQWVYNNNSSFLNVYGRLYTPHAATDIRGTCPDRWHIPSSAEWSELADYLGGRNVAGGKLKSTGTNEAGNGLWNVPNTGATNETGFNAVPGGERSSKGWAFTDMGMTGHYWTSSEDPINFGARFEGFVSFSAEIFESGGADNLGASIRCIRDMDTLAPAVPVLSTKPINNVSQNSCTSGGIIGWDRGNPITEKGICWSSSHNPDVNGSKIIAGSGNAEFTVPLQGLTPATTYYVRAYAVNSAGIAYGNEQSFQTLNDLSGNVKDLEGNVYKTIKIGSQTWMSENLKSTRLNDGTPIAAGDASNWASMNGPGYCWLDDNAPLNANTYGALYNGYVAQSDKACPAGWHVPAKSEWDTLINYLGGRNVAAGNLKEAGTAHWLSPNAGADNSSGFTALPGSSRSSGGKGGEVGFTIPGYMGNWWTSTNSYPTTLWIKAMFSDQTEVASGNGTMRIGNSIRCIMGESKPPVSAPRLVTSEIVNLTKTEASGGAVITTDGDGYIRSSGLCWSLESNPDTLDFKTNEGSQFEQFKSSLTGLIPDTVYHVRAYAVNQAGIGFGNEISFRTLPDVAYGSITDVVGNTYLTVKIGSQEWMAENLKTHYYNDATAILYLPGDSDWAATTSPAWSYLNQDVELWKLYGLYYNFFAVQTDKLCPAGWRIPSDTDWETLVSSLGGQDVAGGKLKEIGTGHWASPNAGATNEYGFSGIGAGLRSTVGPYAEMGKTEAYWSTSQPGIWTLNNENSRLEHQIAFGDNNGYHVRCMKDSAE